MAELDTNSSVVVEQLAGETRIQLPARSLGSLRSLGWIGIAIGSFGLIFTGFWIAGPIWIGVQAIRDQQYLFGIIALLFSAAGFAGIRFGWIAFSVGLGVLRDDTSTEIVWRDGRLRVVERLAWFRWKRRCKLPRIEALVVEEGLRATARAHETGSKRKRLPVSWAKLEDLRALVAYPQRDEQAEDSMRFPIAVGYPEDMLLALAEQLAERIESEVQVDAATARLGTRIETASADAEATRQTASASARPSSVGPSISIRSSEESDARDLGPLLQPTGSSIVCEETELATVLRIPPVGVFKGSRGLVLFSLIWTVMVAIFTVAICASLLNGDPDGSWLGLALLVPSWAVGLGLGLVGYNMGTRRLTVGVTEDALWIERVSIFGEKVVEYAADQIHDIEVANSGMEVNDVPVRQVSVRAVDGSDFSFGSQLPDDELPWVVDVLRRRMRLDRDGDEEREVDWEAMRGGPAAKRGSAGRVRVVDAASGGRIDVPGDSWPRILLSILVLSLFAVVGGCLIYFVDEAVAKLIGAGFALMALAMMAGALAMHFRRFRFELDREGLQVVRSGVFGRKEQYFPRDGLRVDLVESAVQNNSAGSKTNWVVQIESGDESGQYLYFRPEPQVRYVAATLNIWLAHR